MFGCGLRLPVLRKLPGQDLDKIKKVQGKPLDGIFYWLKKFVDKKAIIKEIQSNNCRINGNAVFKGDIDYSTNFAGVSVIFLN